jgi:hypothetical protein
VHGQRGGQALRNLAREGRPGDDRERHGRTEQFAGNLMQEASAARLEALGRPRHAGVGAAMRRQCTQGVVEGVAGRDHEDPARAGDRRGEIGARAQRIGQGHARQVARVLVRAIDGAHALGVAPPQGGRMAVPRQQCRQRGAPGTGSEYGDRRFGCAHLVLEP